MMVFLLDLELLEDKIPLASRAEPSGHAFDGETSEGA
jgi:hypothetical protein